MKKCYVLPIIALTAAGATLYIGAHNTAQNNRGSVTTHAASTKAGLANLYPSQSLTPGKALPVDTKSVCTPGYSKSVRDVSVATKKQVYMEYGVPYPQPQGSYEVDHFISLELGGSNNITNLWPETASPKPGFHEKDKVEDYLHQQVCSGAITLTEAQREISTDWYAVYLRIAQ